MEAQRLDALNTPIVLFVSVYKDQNPTRNLELEECLWQNKNNPHISEVVEIKDKRPTYQDFFSLFRDDVVNVICNSDIFFDETIALAKTMATNRCYALTRYDWNGNGKATFLNRYDSQDAWIFRGRIKGKKMFADYHLGIPGCDNRIAYEIKKAGYVITNPSVSIHALHYHPSEVRNYNALTEKVPEPYHFIQPCSL